MATRRTKAGEDEKVDAVNLERVIKLLEQEKPITKKLACELLHIAYNTTRLTTLIERHKEKVAKDKARRAEKRGKPASRDEVSYIVQGYLEGETVDSLSQNLHRSAGFVKQVLDTHAVPIRSRSHDYFRPELIPEEAMRDRFMVGETVYSARYDSTAEIKGELYQNNQWVYKIWLLSDRWQQYAFQEAAELASLEHLKPLGVTL